ncbi:hypothetical protein NFI96_023357, partial [Prochilodus magdalenae]
YGQGRRGQTRQRVSWVFGMLEMKRTWEKSIELIGFNCGLGRLRKNNLPGRMFQDIRACYKV